MLTSDRPLTYRWAMRAYWHRRLFRNIFLRSSKTQNSVHGSACWRRTQALQVAVFPMIG